MILTFQLDLDSVKMNQQARYPSQRSVVSEVIKLSINELWFSCLLQHLALKWIQLRNHNCSMSLQQIIIQYTQNNLQID